MARGRNKGRVTSNFLQHAPGDHHPFPDTIRGVLRGFDIFLRDVVLAPAARGKVAPENAPDTIGIKTIAYHIRGAGALTHDIPQTDLTGAAAGVGAHSPKDSAEYAC